jgi:hypothetical protein
LQELLEAKPMSRAEYEEICDRYCPLLSGKVVVEVIRRFLRPVA